MKKPMNDCVFCKIIAGDIPSDKVYEDDFAVAFLDIHPTNPGHTLIVPREHSDNFSVMPDGRALERLFSAVRRVAVAAMKVTGAQGFNTHINTGPVAGQVVMHTHVHVIPRFEGDGHQLWTKKNISKEEIARIAAEMKKHLAA